MYLFSSATIVDYLWKVAWQAAVLALVVLVVTRIAKNAPAHFRHALWMLVLIKFMVPPFVHLPASIVPMQKSVSVRSAASIPAESGTATPKVGADMPAMGRVDSATTPVNPERAPIQPVDYVPMVWLAGIGIMGLLLIIRSIKQARMLKNTAPVDGIITDLMITSAQRMGVRRLPDVRVSSDAHTPMLVRLWHPIVLLPEGVTGVCPANDLEAMLLHELAHVKRRDMAALWLHQIVQVLFFFHPALWLTGKELKRERELACDELVLSKSGIERSKYAAGYVSALKMANSASRIQAALGMAEPFEVEKRRLERIMSYQIKRLSMGWAITLIFLFTAGLATFAGNDMTAKKVMAQMKVERAKAQAAIKSGKYSFTAFSSPLPNADLYSYKTITDIVFSGSKFKETRLSYIRGKRAPKGIVNRTITTYDGKTWIQFSPEYKSGVQRDLSPVDAESYGNGLVNQTHPDIQAPPNTKETDLRVVGNERIDGSECIILQFTYVSNQKNKDNLKWLRKLWVDPSKLYSPVKMQNWSQDRINSKMRLWSEVQSKLRKYNDLWLPESVTSSVYREDTKGKTYRYLYSKTTYSPDFKINVPVAANDLKIQIPAGARIEKIPATGKIYQKLYQRKN